MTEVEKANAPAISLSTKEVDMSAILAKKSKARQEDVYKRQPLLQSEIYGILGTIGEESGEQGYSTFFVGI